MPRCLFHARHSSLQRRRVASVQVVTSGRHPTGLSRITTSTGHYAHDTMLHKVPTQDALYLKLRIRLSPTRPKDFSKAGLLGAMTIRE